MHKFRKITKFFIVAIVVAIVAVIGIVVYIQYSNFRKSQEAHSYSQQNENKNLIVKNQILSVKNKMLKESSSKPHNLGTAIVTASLLNIRQDSSTNLESIGSMVQNSSVEIADTSNPLWYKVKLDLSKLKNTGETDLTGEILYTDSKGDKVCYINPKYIKNGNLSLGNEYYLSSNYLGDKQYEYVEPPTNAKHPFIYGIQFYTPEFAKTLESELWKNLSSEFIKKGYDGLKIQYADRKKVVSKMKKNYYQVVETPPIELAKATMSNDNYIPFIKLVNKENNSSEYTGVLVVNSNSNIKTPADIKGKKICFTSKSSASGYIIQKYYLKQKYNIDIDKDCTIVTKKDVYKDSKDTNFQHDEIPLVVAKGYADVGLCGDFVLTTDGFSKFKPYLSNQLLPYSVIGIDNEDKLQNYFDRNVSTLNLIGGQTLTNNPQSMQKNLWQDDNFVKQFQGVVANTYNLYNEEFSTTGAERGEYDGVKDLVKSEGKH